ncbi:MAG: YkgJ family cysteine cluster protein [Candidatus Thorarchaeota archaeon]
MTEEKSKYSFKCMEQNCSDRVCCTRPKVSVTISDLSRWTLQGYIPQIFPGIHLKVPNNEGDQLRLETMRKPLQKDPDSTSCIFFVEDANACSIRFSRPISCQTFPLEYDGEKFFVTDRACSGIGQGEITKEVLKEARDLAEQEFKERTETLSALPGIYSIVMAEIMRQSSEAMKDISEEDRKKIDEIMAQRKQDESPTEESESD